MTTTSRIPAVIEALVSTLTAALPNVRVFDGQWVSAPDGDYLTVGWTPTGETTTGSQAWADSGGDIRTEQIDVPCYCDSYSGSTVVSTRRAAAFALYGPSRRKRSARHPLREAHRHSPAGGRRNRRERDGARSIHERHPRPRLWQTASVIQCRPSYPLIAPAGREIRQTNIISSITLVPTKADTHGAALA